MDDSNEVDFDDQPLELAHPFMVDLNNIVLANHHFALIELDRTEQEESEQVADVDHEVYLERLSQCRWAFDGYRQAANQLALVGIVTRLKHRIRDLAEKQRNSVEKSLRKQLSFLNGKLGDGPVPLEYFDDLINVRDSIVHADSNAEWQHDQRSRKVAPRYRNAYGKVEFSEAQLSEAVAKAVAQVTWYDEKIQGV
jgi:hypothetical protein